MVENGAVVSAAGTYYDDKIRAVFPEQSCKIAEIIGLALGRQQLLTGDLFVARRIQHFLDTGELAVGRRTRRRFYDTTVCRT